MRAAHLVEGGRLAYGALQLVVPERLCAAVGQRPSSSTLTLTRVLGARHLIQGVLLLATAGPTAHRVGAAVDGLHAVSLVPLGLLADGDDRSLAAVDAVVASLLCLAEMRLSSSVR